MPKKKKLVIYQENIQPIHVEDEDDRSLVEYGKSLSDFMSNNSISILKLSDSCLIAHPSKICSILVEKESEVIEIVNPKNKPVPIPVKPKKKKKAKKEGVDIITDVDQSN